MLGFFWQKYILIPLKQDNLSILPAKLGYSHLKSIQNFNHYICYMLSNQNLFLNMF